MKKLKTKLGAIGLAAFMTVASVIPTCAATNYTAVNGTSCTFNKYLIMDAGDNVPNATFVFTIQPGTEIPATNGVMHVMAGIGTPTIAGVETPNIAGVTFTPADTNNAVTDVGANIDVQRTNEQRCGTADADIVQFDTGEKYVTKQVKVDFSSVEFNEPGIYRYIITEVPSNPNAENYNSGIIHDTDTDRVLDVYVTDVDDATQGAELQVSGYVLHTNDDNVPTGDDMGPNNALKADGSLTDKTDGFTNEYTSKDLKIQKEVSGNEASRDKYFKFTVKATNINAADSYVVSLADDNDANTNDGNADETSGDVKTGGTIAENAGQTNPTTVTGQDLLNGQNFYLQHGQSIVIRGLAPNAGYTVTENAEDYESAVMAGKTNTTGSDGTIGTVAGTNKMAEAGFINTRDGIIPTGVALYAGLGVILVGAAAALFALTRKNRNIFR